MSLRRRSKRSIRATVCFVVVATAMVATDGFARVHRHALIIGANRGNASETPLKYAERDARRIARILREHGGFEPQNIRLKTGVTADVVRAELRQLERRVRANRGEDALLMVYYSGHADAEAMHLDGTLLPLAEVKKAAVHSRAKARVLIVDACRSGAVTRVKGGRRGPAFKVQLDNRLRTRGVAILTSSAAGEVSHESDQIGASFFTHYLASALLGAADRNGDDKVTVDEAFAYASARTLAATSRTLAGPQHPTFQLALGGREALVLTRPTANRAHGILVLADPGQYVIQRRTRSDVVAEVNARHGARRIGLRPGKYVITRNTPAAVYRAEATIRPARLSTISRGDMRAIATSTTFAKGAAQRAIFLQAGGGARGALMDLGAGAQASMGLSWRISSLVVELQAHAGQSSAVAASTRLDTTEWGLGLQAGWMWQRSAWRVGGLVGLGPAWLQQSVLAGNVDQTSLVMRSLAAVRVSRALSSRWSALLDVAAAAYFMPVSDGATTTTGAHFAPSATLRLAFAI